MTELQNKKQIICKECGQVIIDEDVAYRDWNGDYICEDCFIERYFYCEKCGAIEPFENAICVDDMYICEDCANKYYYKCSDCGEYIKDPVIDSNGTVLCEECYENSYHICDQCGEFVYANEANWRDDGCYCDYCFSEFSPDDIFEYHGYNDWQLLATTTTDSLTVDNIGLEIEVSKQDGKITQDDTDEVMNLLLNDGVLMRDNSLKNGFEIVTEPMTREYVYTQFYDHINNTMEYLKHNNYRGHNSGGIHIHINKEAIPISKVPLAKKLLSISNKEFWLNISQREENQLEQWASLYTDSFNNTRYQALNFDDRTGTYELRIFNSNLRTDRIFKNIDCTYSLIDYVNSNYATGELNNYIDYIINNRYKYTYLFNYMLEKNIIKMEDLLQCA